MKPAKQSRIQARPYRLYHLGWCGYCRMVRAVADELGIPLELVDVDRERDARAYLVRELGRATVPVLGIPIPGGERLLPESRDIVRYLQERPDPALVGQGDARS